MRNARVWSILAFGLFLLVVWQPRSPRGFAAEASPSRRRAERSEKRFAASARERGEAFLSKREEKLLKSIVGAGRRRDWNCVQETICDYDGAQTPIYSAALFAAIRCGRFEEGASIYDEMCRRAVWRDLPSFSMALKIFSKSFPDRVPLIWEEAVALHPLDAALCAARIDAAAEAGDVEAARQILVEMDRKSVARNLVHFTAAIRACTNADDQESHEMAKHFFELALGQGVEPDLVAFRELIGAYRQAPLPEVQMVSAFMKDMGLQADNAFNDAYLRTVLKIPKGRKFQSAAEISTMIGKLQDVDRLTEARATLATFAEEGLQLTALGHLLNGALQQLQ